jgi:hypothetical protein
MRKPSALSVPGDDCSSVGRNAAFVQFRAERRHNLVVNNRLIWRPAPSYPYHAASSTHSDESALTAFLAQPAQSNRRTKIFPESAHEMIVAVVRVALTLSMPRKGLRLRGERKKGVGPVFGVSPVLRADDSCFDPVAGANGIAHNDAPNGRGRLMALRILTCVVALGLTFTTGCANRSNYQPACAPAVVATAPVGPSCPPPAAVPIVPPPPQPVVVVPQR